MNTDPTDFFILSNARECYDNLLNISSEVNDFIQEMDLMYGSTALFDEPDDQFYSLNNSKAKDDMKLNDTTAVAHNINRIVGTYPMFTDYFISKVLAYCLSFNTPEWRFIHDNNLYKLSNGAISNMSWIGLEINSYVMMFSDRHVVICTYKGNVLDPLDDDLDLSFLIKENKKEEEKYIKEFTGGENKRMKKEKTQTTEESTQILFIEKTVLAGYKVIFNQGSEYKGLYGFFKLINAVNFLNKPLPADLDMEEVKLVSEADMLMSEIAKKYVTGESADLMSNTPAFIVLEHNKDLKDKLSKFEQTNCIVSLLTYLVVSENKTLSRPCVFFVSDELFANFVNNEVLFYNGNNEIKDFLLKNQEAVLIKCYNNDYVQIGCIDNQLQINNEIINYEFNEDYRFDGVMLYADLTSSGEFDQQYTEKDVIKSAFTIIEKMYMINTPKQNTTLPYRAHTSRRNEIIAPSLNGNELAHHLLINGYGGVNNFFNNETFKDEVVHNNVKYYIMYASTNEGTKWFITHHPFFIKLVSKEIPDASLSVYTETDAYAALTKMTNPTVFVFDKKGHVTLGIVKKNTNTTNTITPSKPKSFAMFPYDKTVVAEIKEKFKIFDGTARRFQFKISKFLSTYQILVPNAPKVSNSKAVLKIPKVRINQQPKTTTTTTTTTQTDQFNEVDEKVKFDKIVKRKRLGNYEMMKYKFDESPIKKSLREVTLLNCVIKAVGIVYDCTTVMGLTFPIQIYNQTMGTEMYNPISKAKDIVEKYRTEYKIVLDNSIKSESDLHVYITNTAMKIACETKGNLFYDLFTNLNSSRAEAFVNNKLMNLVISTFVHLEGNFIFMLVYLNKTGKVDFLYAYYINGPLDKRAIEFASGTLVYKIVDKDPKVRSFIVSGASYVVPITITLTKQVKE